LILACYVFVITSLGFTTPFNSTINQEFVILKAIYTSVNVVINRSNLSNNEPGLLGLTKYEAKFGL
jgi:hypothetical protein